MFPKIIHIFIPELINFLFSFIFYLFQLRLDPRTPSAFETTTGN